MSQNLYKNLIKHCICKSKPWQKLVDLRKKFSKRGKVTSLNPVELK